MERLGDEELVYFRTIGIRRVDEIHAELNGATQNLERVRAIGRPAPYPLTRQPHRAVTESIDREVAADNKRRVAG